MLIEKTGRCVESIVDGEIVLLALDAGQFKSIKDVGLFIWQELDRTHDPVAIKEIVADRFDVTHAVCDREVEAFLDELEGSGLIVRRTA